MTNIGTAPCLDQVHVYVVVDTGYFTTTLRTVAIISSTAMISYRAKVIQLPTRIMMDNCHVGESRELEPHPEHFGWMKYSGLVRMPAYQRLYQDTSVRLAWSEDQKPF
jgi:hypothetical protein